MAMRLLVLISPKWSAITATRGDILLGSTELQEIKTTRSKKAEKGEGPNYALMAFSSSSPNLEVSNDSICSKSCLESVKLPKSQNDQLIKDLKKSELMVLVSKSKDGKTCLEQFSKGEPSKLCKKTHPCAKRNLVPRAVLIKSSLVSFNTARQNISKTAVLVNTARQVNAAHLKTTVNAARPMSYLSKIAHSTVKSPIYKNTTFKNSNINQRVNTVRGKNLNTARPKAVVNADKGNNYNVVKASACWVWKPKHKIQVSDGLGSQKKLIILSNVHGNPQMDLQDQGVIDSGCSRHMIGNMSYLIDYEEIDGGYVAFGGNPKGGKITVKGTIKTVVIDDYSRFTWVFFLATKDETSCIFKSFITGIENLVDHKVKVCGIPDWLFDIDALTRTMNYEPIAAGTQSNGFVGTKASDNEGQAGKQTKPVKDYIFLPLWTADPPYSHDPKSSHGDGSKPLSDDGKKVDEDPRKDSECNDQEKEDNVNNTNNVNAASTNEVNAVGGKTSIKLPFDPNMPSLELL
ncbi:hypothetical protein Tco_0809195 [Tanacetum coccineum]